MKKARVFLISVVILIVAMTLFPLTAFAVEDPNTVTSLSSFSSRTTVTQNLPRTAFPMATYPIYIGRVTITYTTETNSLSNVKIDGRTVTPYSVSYTRYQVATGVYRYKTTFSVYADDVVEMGTEQSLISFATGIANYGVNVKWIDERENAPDTPTLIYNDSSNPDKAVLTGVDSNMEYAYSATASTWTDIEGTSVVFDLPTANRTLYVRQEVAGDYNLPSKPKALTLYAELPAPGVTLDGSSEEIRYFNSNMLMAVDGGEFAAIPEDTLTAGKINVQPIIDSLSAGETYGIYYRLYADKPSSDTYGTCHLVGTWCP